MAREAPESSAVRRAEDELDESSAVAVVLRVAMERVVLRVETVRAVLRVASVGAGRPEATGGVVLPVAMVRAARPAVMVREVLPGVTGDFVTISPIHSVGSPERERGASHAAATMPTH